MTETHYPASLRQALAYSPDLHQAFYAVFLINILNIFFHRFNKLRRFFISARPKSVALHDIKFRHLIENFRDFEIEHIFFQS